MDSEVSDAMQVRDDEDIDFDMEADAADESDLDDALGDEDFDGGDADMDFDEE